MFKLLGFSKKESKEVPIVEVPKKVVENVDPRLIVKTGKRGKTVFMKSPCVPECAGCDKRFTPIPPDEGKEYCKEYPFPEKMWAGLNAKGKSKTCLALYEPKPEKEKDDKRLNPLKASKRKMSQSRVAVVTQEATPKKKNKKERRDSR
jgi:hypothetical protein